jgi:hypothetical protein
VTDLVLAEFADEGNGFQPRRRSDVPGPYWSAVDVMFRTVARQPGIKSTGHLPAWVLVQVDVSDHGSQWCLIVQGRGGTFGPAGTSQFLFAPAARWHPASLWDLGRKLVVHGDGRLDPAHPALLHGSDLPPTPWVEPQPDLRPQVEYVLRGLWDETPRIGIDGGPEVAEAVVHRVLAGLPTAIAAQHAWTTWLLEPDPTGRPVVGGRWPDALRESEPGRRLAEDVDRSFLPLPPSGNPDASLERALQAWVEVVALGRDEQLGWLRSLSARSVTTLLEEVFRVWVPPQVEDVDRMLRTDAGHLTLAQHPDVVARWVQRYPLNAVDLVTRVEGQVTPGVRVALVDGFARLSSGPPGLPPQREPVTGWARAFGAMLRENYPHPEARAAYVERLWASGSWTGDGALAGAHEWLRGELRLAPAEFPRLFPGRLGVAARELTRAGRVTELVRGELSRAGAPVTAVEELLRRVDRLPPEGAADLVRLLARSAEPADSADVVRVTAAKLAMPSGDPERSADQVQLLFDLTEIEQQPARTAEALLAGAVAALAGSGAHVALAGSALRDRSLDLLLRPLRQQYGAETAEQVRKLLAGPDPEPELLGPVPPAIVQADPGRYDDPWPGSEADRPRHPILSTWRADPHRGMLGVLVAVTGLVILFLALAWLV